MGKPRLSRRDVINRNAFRAGTAAAKLREALTAFNDALLEAARCGVRVELVVGYHGCDEPPYCRVEGTMTRGRRGVIAHLTEEKRE